MVPKGKAGEAKRREWVNMDLKENVRKIEDRRIHLGKGESKRQCKKVNAKRGKNYAPPKDKWLERRGSKV